MKKIREEHSKNNVKKGLKIKFPTTLINERGSPHKTKIGKVAKEIKSCICINRKVVYFIFVKYCFILFNIPFFDEKLK